MATIKDLAKRPEAFASGHRACIGCLPAVALRQVTKAAGNHKIVVGFATGCMEVVSTIFPYSAWNVPYIHNAFENAAATVSGVEAAYQSLKRQGKINDEIKFIAFGGDGGTYDIGFQALSGAMERGHDMLYIAYNNEAYMNTGIQRSSATPMGAQTSTSPVGKVQPGKKQFPKDLTEIMVAHDLPYVAQANVANWKDLANKVEKALSIKGPKFINILAPCTLGWKYPSEKGVDIAKLATDSCLWPLYEAEYGERKITYMPREKVPVTEYLKHQGRFRHLFRPENEHLLEEIQKEVDRKWERLLRLAGKK
jgi:pyruvate ferredoxin oxidoreductase beta subunit